MKKLLALLSSVCFILAGCSAPAPEIKAKDILSLFGSDKTEVLQSLSLPNDLEEESNRDELLVFLPAESDEKEAALIFYNDVLMGIHYTFSDTNAAYTFAKELRPELDEVFGEKTTYPGVVSSSSAYFDDLTDSTQIQPIISYYEDWTPAVNEEQISKMLDGRETERVDARLTLTAYPEHGTEVKIRYMAIIKR